MTWFAVGAAVVSAVVGVTSAVSQGKQAQAAAQSNANIQDYNAKMADIQATQTYAAAGREEDAQRAQVRQQVGLQLASSASAGAGLNGDLLRQSLYAGEADTQAIRYQAGLKAQGLSDQSAINTSGAAASRSQGNAAVSGSYLNAAGSLLNSASTYYNGQQKIAAARKGNLN